MRSSHSLLRGLAWFSCLLMAAGGCRLGPDYEPPQVAVPEQFQSADDRSATAVPETPWWESFGDPVLAECVALALEGNQDLQAAAARTRTARAMRRLEAGRYLPQVDSRLAYTVDRLSGNNPRFQDAISAGIFPRDVDYWDLGFDVTWELDLFGGTRRRVESAAARVEEEELMRQAVAMTLAAEVGRNYFELLGNRERLRTLEALIDTETRRLDLLEQRHAAGLLSADRVLPERIRLEQKYASLPPLRAEITATEYRLAVLLGRNPGELPDGLLEDRALPGPGGRVPVGLPSELLERRPDVKAAERHLAAAVADIGAARAEFFPRFFLTGSPKLQSGDFADLFNGASSAWVFGPSVQWKVFSAGRNRAQLDAARTRGEQAALEYESAIKRVLEEVESSLIRYAGEAEAWQRQDQAVADLERQLALQIQRRAAGLTRQDAVLAAERELVEGRLQRLDRQVALLTRLVQLHKALGGGWPTARQIAGTTVVPD